MPLAPVDDSGTQLYYVDSGAPSESNKEYATLVLIHGAIFHSGMSVACKLQIVLISCLTHCRSLQGALPMGTLTQRPTCCPQHERLPWLNPVHRR